jgi:putative ABC transport system permease protein
MFFVGTAMTARVVVRPLASAIGWPLQRLHPVVGELARDNAARNPARTAVTAAALMVGLALVVFVAVLAAGLKDSITGGIDRRLAGADLFLTNGNLSPVSPGVAKVVAGAPGVSFVSPQYDEQVEVNGRKVSTLTDVLNGVEPARFARIYRADWRHGSEAALLRLTGDQAIIEEQFARQHGLAVGDRFRIRLANGRTAVLRATAEYRDPQVLQGLIINARTFRALSTTDPYGYFVQARPGVSDTTLQASVQRAVSGFPTLKVRTMPEYRQYIEGQVDRIVYLLYALLAMSVVISLFGIANSLFLAIHERTHELGLLRAIGGTAAQVRRMIRDESVITAVIGGLLGTAIGTLFAWLMTFALSDVGVGFHLPAGQLVGFLALAVAVGWIGAAMPARRAGRLNILEAVAE